MSLRILSAVLATALFVAYFAPIVFKLRDLPLAVVVLGGTALALTDAWQAAASRKG